MPTHIETLVMTPAPRRSTRRRARRHGVTNRISCLYGKVEGKPPESHMRVLLRNAKTRKYLGASKRWTKDHKRAQDFHNGWWAAICAFTTMDPRNLVIDYQFDDDRYNLHIPVAAGTRVKERY